MIEIALAFLKPVISWFTGEGRLKWLVLGVGVVTLAGSVWYLTDQYNSVKIENAELTSELRSKTQVIAQLQQSIIDLQNHNQRIQDEFERSQVVVKNVQSKFIELEKEKNDAQQVFDKECGRFERLMQRKASLVVRFANRATERMRGEFERTTADSDN